MNKLKSNIIIFNIPPELFMSRKHITRISVIFIPSVVTPHIFLNYGSSVHFNNTHPRLCCVCVCVCVCVCSCVGSHVRPCMWNKWLASVCFSRSATQPLWAFLDSDRGQYYIIYYINFISRLPIVKWMNWSQRNAGLSGLSSPQSDETSRPVGSVVLPEASAQRQLLGAAALCRTVLWTHSYINTRPTQRHEQLHSTRVTLPCRSGVYCWSMNTDVSVVTPPTSSSSSSITHTCNVQCGCYF